MRIIATETQNDRYRREISLHIAIPYITTTDRGVGGAAMGPHW